MNYVRRGETRPLSSSVLCINPGDAAELSLLIKLTLACLVVSARGRLFPFLSQFIVRFFLFLSVFLPSFLSFFFAFNFFFLSPFQLLDGIPRTQKLSPTPYLVRAQSYQRFFKPGGGQNIACFACFACCQDFNPSIIECLIFTSVHTKLILDKNIYF